MSNSQTDAAPTNTDASALAPLRFPVFRAVWISSTVSNLGGLIQTVGASWLMISLTQSADLVALVQASASLPVMLLSLAAGAMADNMNRRHVMLGAQLFQLVVSLLLAVIVWIGWITPWTLLLFSFLIGVGGAFNAPAWQASVGDMIPRPHLPAAVALNSMGFNIARSVGPAIGGAIVAMAGAATAFAVNALSYIGLIAVLMRWRPAAEPKGPPRETLWIAMGAGVRYVWMSPAISIVLLRSMLFGVGASAVMALLPLIAKVRMGGGPLTYGLLLGAFGAGAVAAALSSASLRRDMTTESLVRWASAAFAVAAAIIGVSTQLPLTLLALVASGAGWVLALSTFNVAVQLSAPRWVVARALALYQMAAFGGITLGSWAWGAIADAEGLAAALLGAAATLAATALLGFALPLRQTEELNLDPLRRWKEPVTAVPVESRTGPVVIMVEYIIDEEDVLEFLDAMAERRRIRRRDGARNWTLLRDLADRRVWIERYNTPTWADYVRLNSRMTHEDVTIPERLRKLHRGPDLPAVRRMIERQTGSPPIGHTSTGAHELARLLNDPERPS